MKLYMERDYLIAYIDPITVTNKDGSTEKEVNVKKIKDIVTALKLLDKKVKRIELPSGTFLNMDTDFSVNRHYKRFPNATLDKVYDSISNWRRNGREIYIKGNRLYVKEDGYEIILPRYMSYEFGNDALKIKIYFE